MFQSRCRKAVSIVYVFMMRLYYHGQNCSISCSQKKNCSISKKQDHWSDPAPPSRLWFCHCKATGSATPVSTSCACGVRIMHTDRLIAPGQLYLPHLKQTAAGSSQVTTANRPGWATKSSSTCLGSWNEDAQWTKNPSWGAEGSRSDCYCTSVCPHTSHADCKYIRWKR